MLSYSVARGKAQRGTWIFSPGRTESATVFSELIYDLVTRGYSVAVLDPRGQGMSGRLVPGSDVGHVGRFEDYQQDFEAFLELSDLVSLPRPWRLLANSMGAAIALPALTRDPKRFASAAFVAPMLQIDTGVVPQSLALALARGLGLILDSSRYFPSRGPFNLEQPFEGNIFTRSKPRFEMDLETLRANRSAVVGGPSLGWLRETLLATAKLPAFAAQVQVPLLVFTAGDDRIVKNEPIRKFCQQAPRCQLVNYPGAMHLLLMELDAVRNDLLTQLESHARP